MTLLQTSTSLLRSNVISLGEEISSQLSQPIQLTTHGAISWRMMKWSLKWFSPLCGGKRNLWGQEGIVWNLTERGVLSLHSRVHYVSKFYTWN